MGRHEIVSASGVSIIAIIHAYAVTIDLSFILGGGPGWCGRTPHSLLLSSPPLQAATTPPLYGARLLVYTFVAASAPAAVASRFFPTIAGVLSPPARGGASTSISRLAKGFSTSRYLQSAHRMISVTVALRHCESYGKRLRRIKLSPPRSRSYATLVVHHEARNDGEDVVRRENVGSCMNGTTNRLARSAQPEMELVAR